MDLGVTAVMLPELDFEEQIALCAELGLHYYQYRPRIIPEAQRSKPYSNWGNHKFDLTPQIFLREGAVITAQLRKAGLEPWGALPSANIDDPDETLRLHLEGAAKAQARCVRVDPPPCPDKPFNYAELLERMIRRYDIIVRTMARPLGIKIIIETHCRSLVTSPGLAWAICRHFDPRELGVIFDIANFTREGELHPNLAVSVLRDYIDCVHLGGSRRVVDKVDALGCNVVTVQFSAFENSDLHIPTWLNALHAAGVKAPIIIEDFTPDMTGTDRLRRDVAFLNKVIAGTLRPGYRRQALP
ncbi:MAG: TIM barrel protein [Kiritimatiellae bacterium]|nr:TIM barrel protein [Kiritimatiellia bacterium]